MKNFPAIGFSRSEFACKCGCGFDTVDAELLVVLRDLKSYYDGAIVRIGSACRCETHNAKEGGASDSMHLVGKAADVVVVGVDPDEVYDYLDRKYSDKYGVGRYVSFTHIDPRYEKGRW